MPESETKIVSARHGESLANEDKYATSPYPNEYTPLTTKGEFQSLYCAIAIVDLCMKLGLDAKDIQMFSADIRTARLEIYFHRVWQKLNPGDGTRFPTTLYCLGEQPLGASDPDLAGRFPELGKLRDERIQRYKGTEGQRNRLYEPPVPRNTKFEGDLLLIINSLVRSGQDIYGMSLHEHFEKNVKPFWLRNKEQIMASKLNLLFMNGGSRAMLSALLLNIEKEEDILDHLLEIYPDKRHAPNASIFPYSYNSQDGLWELRGTHFISDDHFAEFLAQISTLGVDIQKYPILAIDSLDNSLISIPVGDYNIM